MAHDIKHQRTVTVRLTDKEFMDAAQEAEHENRPLAELFRHWVKERMYGTLRAHPCKINENQSFE